jgi:hypothetical protein
MLGPNLLPGLRHEIGRNTLPSNIRLHRERRPIDMFWIIVIALVAIVAVAVVGFLLHFLFSPWRLVAAIGMLAWLKFRPRRSRL